MKVNHGKGTSGYGSGVSIELDGDEVAIAIDEYIAIRNIKVSGPRTISVNGQSLEGGRCYVDPSGTVTSEGETFFGAGSTKQHTKNVKLIEGTAEYIESVLDEEPKYYLDSIQYTHSCLMWETEEKITDNKIPHYVAVLRKQK